MGKIRRQKKPHTAGKEKSNHEEKSINTNVHSGLPLYAPETDNIFNNVNTNNKLKFIIDNARSEKSFKSIKSDMSLIKQMTKKEKRNLKHNLIMKKLSSPYNMKRNMQLKLKKYANNNKPISDSIEMSLQSFLQKQPPTIKQEEKINKKSTEKAVKRKKAMIKNTNRLKRIFNNKPERYLTAYLTEQVKKNIKKRNL